MTKLFNSISPVATESGQVYDPSHITWGEAHHQCCK